MSTPGLRIIARLRLFPIDSNTEPGNATVFSVILSVAICAVISLAAIVRASPGYNAASMSICVVVQHQATHLRDFQSRTLSEGHRSEHEYDRSRDYIWKDTRRQTRRCHDLQGNPLCGKGFW